EFPRAGAIEDCSAPGIKKGDIHVFSAATTPPMVMNSRRFIRPLRAVCTTAKPLALATGGE
ncbi:MAG: hypothetical protein WA309_01050, partial [Pseudolabrys sp.]